VNLPVLSGHRRGCACDNGGLALGADEDDGLIGKILIMADKPERCATSSAVLPEHPEVVTGQQGAHASVIEMTQPGEVQLDRPVGGRLTQGVEEDIHDRIHPFR
jgi:hypothetical protein